eukprot:TRINITY_DN15785_c0_g1_i1.p1 TRINITY_DN15785_c0_g1~~TRINITY_DN15785_c0_g1_i1.p1  ORF type:complete len:222 (+),score=38.33 TRINITY_DN15785_c0_g1_i1:35-667(+)
MAMEAEADMDYLHEEEPPLETLRRVWLNEYAAPEILQYHEEFVASIMAIVHEQQAIIANLEASVDEMTTWSVNIYRLEVERILYVMKSYLRIRLQKIEKHAMAIMSSDMRDWLSDAEKKFANGLLTMTEDAFTSSFLKTLPAKFASMSEEPMIPKPLLTNHVFCKPREDCGEIRKHELDDAVIPLRANDIYALPYVLVRDFVHDGKVDLI